MTSITVLEIPVRTTVAPRDWAKSYNRSTHQSASFRASQGEANFDSTSAGMSTPVCGMLAINGASPRRIVSQGGRDADITRVE